MLYSSYLSSKLYKSCFVYWYSDTYCFTLSSFLHNLILIPSLFLITILIALSKRLTSTLFLKNVIEIILLIGVFKKKFSTWNILFCRCVKSYFFYTLKYTPHKMLNLVIYHVRIRRILSYIRYVHIIINIFIYGLFVSYAQYYHIITFCSIYPIIG